MLSYPISPSILSCVVNDPLGGGRRRVAGEHFVTVAPYGGDESVLYASALTGTNRLKLEVCGNDDQISVTALFDNLGKGASGAAVQNMNIMLGLDETAGLE